jgi:hypothetical protein
VNLEDRPSMMPMTLNVRAQPISRKLIDRKIFTFQHLVLTRMMHVGQNYGKQGVISYEPTTRRASRSE